MEADHIYRKGGEAKADLVGQCRVRGAAHKVVYIEHFCIGKMTIGESAAQR